MKCPNKKGYSVQYKKGERIDYRGKKRILYAWYDTFSLEDAEAYAKKMREEGKEKVEILEVML